MAAEDGSALWSNMPADWGLVIRDWTKSSLYCVNNHWFWEIENVGRWQCKQHFCDPEVQSDGVTYWPCCGRFGEDDPGCVDADHRNIAVMTKTTRFTTEHTLELPGVVAARLRQHAGDAKMLPGFSEADPIKGSVKVLRFDPDHPPSVSVAQALS